MHAAWRLVRSAGVCVSPYYPTPILLSTSPTKLVEYMALGKAVVANDHPEQSLVLKESGGGLICRWDESEFATAMQTLLERPELADSMGLAGRRFVDGHRTHTAMASLVLSTYRDALEGGRSRPVEPGASPARWPAGRTHRHENR
jgi:glycosyltransferase involved in cell wall biosynthesis